MSSRVARVAFSLNGLSLLVGAVGFLSGVVGIFVDVNESVSVKWFLFSLLISIWVVLILSKVVYDLAAESKTVASFEQPIRFVSEESVFVIRRNENFLNNIIVGCYSKRDEVDRLAYLGVVHIVQDNIIQIKIYHDYGVLPAAPTTREELTNVMIRPVVPVTALQQFAISGGGVG